MNRKYLISCLALVVCSFTLIAQNKIKIKKPLYLPDCDCYLDSAYEETREFNPKLSEIYEVEKLLPVEESDTASELHKNLPDFNRWIRYYKGEINNRGQKILRIFSDFRPDEYGLKPSDGQWIFYFNLQTKKFYGFKQVGG